MLFLSGLVLVVELLPCGRGEPVSCTEMDLVSGVTEQELRMLFVCHLRLTGMSLPRCSSLVPERQVCRAHTHSFAQSAAKGPVASPFCSSTCSFQGGGPQ